ncbi:MAG TPA: sarcosine oxidase subunit gamma family protein [Steroidobacteraceae bacterium]
MGSAPGLISRIEASGLSVAGMQSMEVAALRYFDATGPFAAAVQDSVGAALPAPLTAVSVSAPGGGRCILAWRSPTETWLLCDDSAVFAELEEELLSPAGCMVNQTGGLCALQLRGARVAELLSRLGSAASLAGAGEARSSRVADLHVLIICVQQGEWILMVERVYVAHLLDWIAKTIAD